MIGICIGDAAGVGPEVTLKALKQLIPESGNNFLLVGDVNLITGLDSRLGLNLPLNSSRIQIHNPGPCLSSELIPGSAVVANAAMSYLEEAARRCLRKELKGMVTAPLNKEAVIKTGRKFMGQTEFLSELAGTQDTAMMLMGADDRDRWLRVALVTTHLPLKDVPAAITKEKVLRAIRLADRAGRDLKLPKRRIALCGLNPHAGEGGEIGTEEIDVIIPAAESARAEGYEVTGPLAADTLFYYAYKGDFELVVSMYHDQGLAPLKMIGFESGINWTLGLPFVRTSPDHGTAYDIAGKGVANPNSMVAAIKLALQLAK